MAFSVLQLQHSFQGTSLLPRDRFSNTWYIIARDGTPMDTALFTDLASYVSNFYAINGSPTVSSFLSPVVMGAGETTKIYNMGDPKPRTPLFTRTTSGPAASGTPLPNEVAVCLSYHAIPISGSAPARRRGRLYLGPLSTAALAPSPTGDARVHNSCMSAIMASAAAFNAAVVLKGCDWVVYSPTLGGANKITHISVDNSFDTQRRRGTLSSSAQFQTLSS